MNYKLAYTKVLSGGLQQHTPLASLPQGKISSLSGLYDLQVWGKRSQECLVQQFFMLYFGPFPSLLPHNMGSDTMEVACCVSYLVGRSQVQKKRKLGKLICSHQSPILLAFTSYTADLLIAICQSPVLYSSTGLKFRQGRERCNLLSPSKSQHIQGSRYQCLSFTFLYVESEGKRVQWKEWGYGVSLGF